MRERFTKNKGIIILIFVAVVILVIYEVSGSKKPTPLSPGPSPTETTQQTSQKFTQTSSGYKLPVYSQPPSDSSGQVNVNSPKVQAATSEKSKLAPKLPIYIENFQTKSGIKTTLNVYTIPEDPDYLIHIEVYGINYGDPNLLQDGNNNAQAYVESFNKIESLLSAAGIDVHNIYFITGTKAYVQSAVDNLFRKYNLF